MICPNWAPISASPLVHSAWRRLLRFGPARLRAHWFGTYNALFQGDRFPHVVHKSPPFLSILGRISPLTTWHLFRAKNFIRLAVFWSLNLNNMKTNCIPMKKPCLVNKVSWVSCILSYLFELESIVAWRYLVSN